MLQFQALSSRRFQHGSDKVNLRRLTMPQRDTVAGEAYCRSPTSNQGLTLVHFLAQRKRFVWEGVASGVVWEVFRGYQGVSRVYFVSEMAEVELKGGRV
jgi:hypothetical protein